MKFRLVLVGPDEDPDRSFPARANTAGINHSPSWALRYKQTDSGIIGIQRLPNGRLKSWAVTNFSARIVRDILLDDGNGQLREFGLEAELGKQKFVFTLSGTEFSRVGWILNKLGPEAIVYPGQQQHARAAIQSLSGPIKQEHISSHLGWRKCGAQWVYLHAGGALGADGPVSGLKVELPDALRSYQFPVPEDSAETVRAVRASLQLLSLAPDWISFPLLASVYRAALGAVDFSLFLVGKTGVFKTALAALCQQHFGATMDAGNLPTNFASTAYALEAPAFYAKDALLVVDDFAPTGRCGDVELQNVAERLFRAVGNRQGRSRMEGNGQVSPSKPPRALVLATGEQVPQGHSIRARLLIVEVGPGDIHRAGLSECQRLAGEGRLTASMSAFLRWVAGRYEELQGRLRTRALEIRNQARPNLAHARMPGALAELQTGWEIFLAFALGAGAIDAVEKERLEERSRRALDTLGAIQAKYQSSSDPALHFVSLIQSALACGRAHVADRRGNAPKEAAIWGWRRQSAGRPWIPLGTRIGWLAEAEIFLDPAASYHVAQEVSGAERLAASEQTLRHRLREVGLLASIDQGRGMVQVRRTLDGAARLVLHLKTRDLVRK